MSRPPARPLQRTPRAPLLEAPAPASSAVAEDTSPRESAQPSTAATPPSPAEESAEERFLSTRVPKDLHRQVRQASVDQDIPIREIIISAVTEWLEHHQRP